MMNGKISDSSRLGDLGLTLFQTTQKREKILITQGVIKSSIEGFTSL